MSEKSLKFGNIRVNEKGFHKSKQAIDLDSINADHIAVSVKFKHSDDGFNISLVIKKVKLLNRYVLSYLN